MPRQPIRIHVAVAVALAAGLILPGVSAASPASLPDGANEYKYVTVALPREVNTGVADINGSGVYVGAGCDATCTNRVQFIATPQGKLTFYTIPFANFSPSAPYLPVGIDDRGDIAGQYTDTQGAMHGYLRGANGAAWIEINDPNAPEIGGGGTTPESISADGSVIVGAYFDASLVQHGFLERNGKFTTYDVPGASATAVNFYYDGEFGGDYVASDGAMYAFYVKDGRRHTVPAPGLPNPSSGQGADFVAVGSDGTLFGNEFSDNPFFGFAYADGRYTTIKDPQEVATSSLDGSEINNANLDGVLVGNYTAGTSTQPPYIHGFIATPQQHG
jgi:hypothetical protein